MLRDFRESGLLSLGLEEQFTEKQQKYYDHMMEIWPEMDRNMDDKVTFEEYFNYLQRYYVN